MTENMRIYEKTRSVPDNAQKKIEGGRLKGYTDISPMWRISKLTELFGPCGIGWKIENVCKDIVTGSDGTIAMFVEIELFYKEDLSLELWSGPLHGCGGSMFVSKESKGMYTDDEALKKAFTDAIGSACKLLGMGADIYWEADATKHNKRGQDNTTQPKNTAQKQPIQKSKEEFNEGVFWGNIEQLGWKKDDVIKHYEGVVDFNDITVEKAREVYLEVKNTWGKQ